MVLRFFSRVLVVLFIFLFLNLWALGNQEKETNVTQEGISVTKHSINVNGNVIKYTARAGTILLIGEDDTPKINFFFISYSKDDVKDISQRPITFSFNGGPGSSSVWLNLGALGPKKVLMDDEGFTPSPPYRLVDNEYTFLDVTDLVFIDPVSTGFSRAVPGVNPKQYHGFKGDIASIGEFIRLYITRFKRWASPKFIIGESYGTQRAAGLVDFLQNRYGMYFNGIILVSAALNELSFRLDPGNDMSYIMFLPSLTATAWYHKKLPEDLQADLQKTLRIVEKFALEEYSLALMKGDELSQQDREEIVEKLSRFTALSPKYIEQSNLRINHRRFLKEFLRNESMALGRYDSRIKGIDSNTLGERIENDPSDANIWGAFTATFNEYLRSELKYDSDLIYEIKTRKVRPWKYDNAVNRYLYVGDEIRLAMIKNHYLRVYIANGFYDFATPYFATKYEVSHLGLDPEFKKRIQMGYFEAGHMMYIHKQSHEKFKKEIAEFIRLAILD